MNSSKHIATPDSIRVVKSATCPSLSGKSKLSYEVGCKDGSEIQVRIVANSASGSYNREWIDIEAVRSAIDKGPRGAPITSDVLRPLFRGKSVNNQLFLFAILKHEGLVRQSGTERRSYERVDFGEFVKRTHALIEGKGVTATADVKTKVSKAKAAAAAKKRSVASKK